MPNILIVEDDPDIRTMLAFRLDSAGFTVTIAGNVRDALAAARHRRPDVVLLDVQLPGRSGLEFCREARTDPDLANVPIVVATASVGATAAAAAFDAGADEFVAKPFNLAALLTCLRSAAHYSTRELAGVS